MNDVLSSGYSLISKPRFNAPTIAELVPYLLEAHWIRVRGACGGASTSSAASPSRRVRAVGWHAGWGASHTRRAHAHAKALTP